jgi:hypothetical protein
MAYIKEIKPNSSDSHQTSPGYVLTFIPFVARETKPNNTVDEVQLSTRKPFCVINDAINVSVNYNKSSYQHTMSAILLAGDINYPTAICPGDFVVVNMLNWQTDVKRVYDQALGFSKVKNINNYDDGFKGIFKVQSVRRNLRADPETGIKSFAFTVSAAAFTEFNNIFNFNPAIQSAFTEKGTELYSSIIGDYYANNLKSDASVQTIVADLFDIVIGKSQKNSNLKVQNYGNTHFIMPYSVGVLLGRQVKVAADLYNYIIGIWGSGKTTGTIGAGFNLDFIPDTSKGVNFYKTGQGLQGNKIVNVENWNNATAWSIVRSNTNELLNEMYSCNRIAPDGKIYPTVVVRQKPFTSESFQGKLATKFLSLPRWKISPDLLYSASLGREEAARFNFIQVFTRATADTEAMDMTNQIGLGNFLYDNADIQKHGLKPYIVTSNFDFPTSGPNKAESKQLRAREWTELMADMVMGGHLKEAGSLEFVGIQDPICIGDNLELDGIVYHIESISHTMSIAPSGHKTFRTNIQVSHGVDLASETMKKTIYPEMQHTDSAARRKEDWKENKILPGFSDTQDIPGRSEGEEITDKVDLPALAQQIFSKTKSAKKTLGNLKGKK